MTREMSNQTVNGRPVISVTIYLKGSALDPARVTQVLGREPSRAQKKGEFQAESTRFIAKFGMWALELSSETRPALELIDDLLRQLGNPTVSLREIEGVEHAELDVFAARDEAGDAGPVLQLILGNDQMTRLHQLGLSLSITVY